ncbi:MAG: Wzz/FepE/Etk N-terminal domain-containing protein [Lachnospiraceae bacterium]|nr:Wzz/FepE/Etk N-terminal domain-containing protein [Lachnospiraceae bacterium]
MQEKQKKISENRELQWDIESIIRDVLRQWWVILLVAIAAAALTGAYVKMTYQPQYSATTTFVVGKSGFSSNTAADNLNSAKSMTERLSQIMQSSILKERVCEKLGLESFDADVNISVVEASNLMTLTVKAKSPMLSYRMIHAVMDEVTVLSGELMENISVRVIQEPAVPMEVSNPLNVKKEMKMAAMLGVIAMVFIFAVLSYNKDTVKNEDEMNKKIDARLLGTIYHERKHKTLRSWLKKQIPSLCIDSPGLSFGYVESVKMLATRVQRQLDKEGKKILLVTSVSENEGKSTVAANLALALAREDHSVILVDCDFRKPSQYKIFELPEKDRKQIDLGLLLRSKEPVKIKTAGIEKKLKVLFSVKPHKRMMSREVTEYLETVLNALKKVTDYIIVDSSPMALVAESEVIANLADASLLVVQQDVMEACYINDTIDQLNRTKGKVLGCVYNNVRAGLIGKSREYGHYYGKYGYGYDYSRYGYYGKKTKQSNQSKKQEE